MTVRVPVRPSLSTFKGGLLSPGWEGTGCLCYSESERKEEAKKRLERGTGCLNINASHPRVYTVCDILTTGSRIDGHQGCPVSKDSCFYFQNYKVFGYFDPENSILDNGNN